MAEEKALIPNFVGATLPRCDQGDREYYCSAMMTLFKPWRSGLDLKDSDESWDDVFSLFKFTDRQNELMVSSMSVLILVMISMHNSANHQSFLVGLMQMI